MSTRGAVVEGVVTFAIPPLTVLATPTFDAGFVLVVVLLAVVLLVVTVAEPSTEPDVVDVVDDTATSLPEVTAVEVSAVVDEDSAWVASVVWWPALPPQAATRKASTTNMAVPGSHRRRRPTLSANTLRSIGPTPFITVRVQRPTVPGAHQTPPEEAMPIWSSRAERPLGR